MSVGELLVVPVGKLLVPVCKLLVPVDELLVAVGELLVVPVGRLLVVPVGELLVPVGELLVPIGELIVPVGELLTPDRVCAAKHCQHRKKRDERVPLIVGSTLAGLTALTIGTYALIRYFKIKKVQYDTMH